MAYRCKRPTEITFDIGNGQLRSRDFSSAGCVDIHSRFSILRMQSTARTKDNARNMPVSWGQIETCLGT